MSAKKALFLTTGILMAVAVIMFSVFMVKQALAAGSLAADKTAKVTTYLSESDKSMYEGLPITGSEVMNNITKFRNESTGIIVVTKKSSTQYGYSISISGNTATLGASISSSLKNAQDINHNSYINPNAKFLGEILRDANDVIVGIRFIQQ